MSGLPAHLVALVPTSAGAPAASVAATGAVPSAAAPTIDSTKLKTLLISPMCTWAAKLKPAELCFLMSSPQAPANSAVRWRCETAEEATCKQGV